MTKLFVLKDVVISYIFTIVVQVSTNRLQRYETMGKNPNKLAGNFHTPAPKLHDTPASPTTNSPRRSLKAEPPGGILISE